MANQKLSQVQIDGIEYDIGLKSLELSTGLNGIQQVADGVANGLPFEGENIYAESLDETLKEVQPYGADGEFSAAFGGKSSAQGKRSFTSGTNTIAKGNDAHAEGNTSVALGAQSHAEGTQTVAVGLAAHSEGLQTRAIGDYSHAAGLGTIASNEAQSVVGRYNAEDSDALFIVGSGEDAENPANALSVYPTHSKVGKALSGDQPCLRNIIYGTKSPDTAGEFIADNTLEGIVQTSSNTPDGLSLEAMTYGHCYFNKLYQKALNNCSGTIVIEVSANTDDILIPELDRSTVSLSGYGPRIFLTPSLLPSNDGYQESVYGIKTHGEVSPVLVDDFIWSSAIQVKYHLF